MAPIEDLQSRDLAWISDFVMQQMVIMLRPMMEHLQETDAACDYSQRMVQRLSMDVSEIRGDLERTNKYLAILRQGLGVQNEGKCVLQRSVEDLAKQVFTGTSSIEDLQVKVERLAGEAHAIKDELLNNEARLEVWQKELREFRRGQLGMAPKLEDKSSRPPPSSQSVRAAGTEQAPWPQKKTFAGSGPGPEPTLVGAAASNAGLGGIGAGGAGLGDSAGLGCSSGQSKRVSRVASGSTAALKLPSQEHLDFGLVAQRNGGRAPVWAGVDGLPGSEADDVGAGAQDEVPSATARLPRLAALGQAGGSRPPDRVAADSAPRLRFTATMAKPESRGSPS